MILSINYLEKYGTLTQGFSSEPVPSEGVIALPIKARTYPRHVIVSMDLLVVKLQSLTMQSSNDRGYFPLMRCFYPILDGKVPNQSWLGVA